MPLATWAGPQDAAGYEIRNILLEKVNGLPTANPANEGRIVFDTQTDRFWYSDGAAWGNKASDADALQGQNGAYYLNLQNATGQLAVGNITGLSGVITATRLDQFQPPTADVSLGGRKITSLGDGIANSDAASYGQVLQLINNQVFKNPTRAATTANITLTGLQTVDGVSLTTNDRVLVKDQSTGASNGIYVVQSGAWTRASDADSAAELAVGQVVPVTEGTTNGDKLFMNTTVKTGAIVVGTDALVFTPYGAASGEIGIAGNGILKSGTTYSAKPYTGITVDGNGIGIDRTLTNGTKRTAQFIEGNITGASGGDVTITHGLGTQYPTIKVYDITATPAREVQVGVQPASTTTAVLSFGATPADNRYHWSAAG